jgi:hypothetical protein
MQVVNVAVVVVVVVRGSGIETEVTRAASRAETMSDLLEETEIFLMIGGMVLVAVEDEVAEVTVEVVMEEDVMVVAMEDLGRRCDNSERRVQLPHPKRRSLRQT